MTKTIGLINNDQLQCPVCGESNLHQYRCEVYWRDAEDSKLGNRIASGESGILAISRHMHGNPSSRRDGILIGFWCEECLAVTQESDLSLVVYQHKGTTYVEWKLD